MQQFPVLPNGATVTPEHLVAEVLTDRANDPVEALRALTAALLTVALTAADAGTSRDIQTAGRFLHHSDPGRWCATATLAPEVLADQIASSIYVRRHRCALPALSASYVRVAEATFLQWTT